MEPTSSSAGATIFHSGRTATSYTSSSNLLPSSSPELDMSAHLSLMLSRSVWENHQHCQSAIHFTSPTKCEGIFFPVQKIFLRIVFVFILYQSNMVILFLFSLFVNNVSRLNYLLLIKSVGDTERKNAVQWIIKAIYTIDSALYNSIMILVLIASFVV